MGINVKSQQIAGLWSRDWTGNSIAGYLVALALLATATGCTGTTPVTGSGNSDAKPKRLRIVTTVGMVTDIVRQIVGDRAEVQGLLGEGVDPHLYKPTRHDVQQLMDADVVIYGGLFLEGRMQETFERLSKSNKHV